MSPAVAEATLDTIRRSLRLSVGCVQVYRYQDRRYVWRLDATDARGQRYTAEHEDYGAAVLLLGELVGFEVGDG